VELMGEGSIVEEEHAIHHNNNGIRALIPYAVILRPRHQHISRPPNRNNSLWIDRVGLDFFT